MISEVIVPVLGETMNEGTVVGWLVREGQPVRQGDVLFNLESDKATLEVEAPAAGYLRKILVPAGQTVPVLTVVALISTTADETLEAYRPMAAIPAASGAPISAVAPAAVLPAPNEVAGGRVIASPRARRRARELGMDLRLVHGTGPGGRIAERDLAAWQPAPTPATSGTAMPRATPVAQRMAADLAVDLAAVHGSGPGGRITRTDVQLATRRAPTPAPGLQPLSRAQRLAAERMTASFSTAPHFYLHVEVDARPLVALRESLLPILEQSAGVRLTFTDLLVKLCALTLLDHPRAMAQWTDAGLRLASEANIGIAVDAPTGLIVPVIRRADRISLAALAQSRAMLAERARAGKLTPADLEGGVFTLTNLGMFAVDFFDAILYPPQAAILAIGRIRDRALVDGGRLVAAPTMTFSLSVDHRVLDGAGAARFLGDLVQRVEAPDLKLE